MKFISDFKLTIFRHNDHTPASPRLQFEPLCGVCSGPIVRRLRTIVRRQGVHKPDATQQGAKLPNNADVDRQCFPGRQHLEPDTSALQGGEKQAVRREPCLSCEYFFKQLFLHNLH